MAIEELKSTAITAFENIRTGAGTTPASMLVHGGMVREAVGTFEVGAFDALSTYKVCRLPSYARIKAITLKCDAMTGGPIDVGLYRTPENGGAAVDLDCYTTDAVVTSAINTTELNFKYEALNVDKIEQRLWQDGGLAADPNQMLDVVVTTSTAVTVGGTLSVSVEYVDGN